MDPNYAVLVDSNNNNPTIKSENNKNSKIPKTTIIAVVVSVVGFTIIIGIFIFFIKPKIEVWLAVRNDATCSLQDTGL